MYDIKDEEDFGEKTTHITENNAGGCYFVGYMNIEYNYLSLQTYKQIKNYLLDIEHMCEIIKPTTVANQSFDNWFNVYFE